MKHYKSVNFCQIWMSTPLWSPYWWLFGNGSDSTLVCKKIFNTSCNWMSERWNRSHETFL